MNGWTLTEHSRKRRKFMHITEHQIEAVINDPEMVYPCDDPRYTFYQRGELVVLVEPAKREVVTIIYHRALGRDSDGGPLRRVQLA